MKITLTFEIPSALRHDLEAAVEAMLATLPNTVKAEWTETRKYQMLGGRMGQRQDEPTPVERAIRDASGETET